MATTVTAKPIARPAPKSRNVWVIAGAGAGGVVVLALLVWVVMSVLGNNEPRLNENTVVLAKFMESSSFAKMEYEKQRQYYKVLDDRNAELDQSFKDHRLTEPEYRTALEAAWLGKHIKRVEKYHALPPGQPRADYIDKLLDKKERKAENPKSGEIKADETAAEMKVEKWPPAVRQQWEAFHNAYSKEKKLREPASKPVTRPGSPSTPPSTPLSHGHKK